jgi:protein-disulfide isomerase
MLKKYHIIALFFILSLCTMISAQAFSTLDALLHHSNDPIGGNARGNITIVEFFDYQCSHCVDMAPVMNDIINANPNVRVVYKDFPIRGSLSDYAALAALAANQQGKYIEFNHALLSSSQSLSKESILDIAKSLKINIKKFTKDMANIRLKNQLKDNRELAQAMQLTGTPAFFIGKTNAKHQSELHFILGAATQSEIQAAIDKASR